MADANSSGVEVRQHSSYGDMARCHPDRPAASRGMCQPCYLQWLRETPKDQRPPVIRAWKRPARKVPSCHPNEEYGAHGLCQKCYLKTYNKEHKARLSKMQSARHLMAKYGITPEELTALEFAQGGVFAICQSPPAEGKKLHVDHCHETGAVRGLLCHSCNWYLGKVDRNPSILDRFKAYREQA